MPKIRVAKILFICLLLAISADPTIDAHLAPSRDKLREPVINDFSGREFSGLDVLDDKMYKINTRASPIPEECLDYNSQVYLNNEKRPIIICEIDDWHEIEKSRIIFSINNTFYCLQMTSRPKDKNIGDVGLYVYQAKDKSVTAKINISRVDDLPDGGEYYGSLEFSVNGKIVIYPIRYYRGG